MKAPSLKSMLFVSSAIGFGGLLLWTAQNVQQKEAHLRALKTAIISERENIRVLEAEWHYLNQPQRLEHLSQKYLDLVPATDHTMALDSTALPEITLPNLPLRKPAYNSSLMSQPPAATKVVYESSSPATPSPASTSPAIFPSPRPAHKPAQNFPDILKKLTREVPE